MKITFITSHNWDSKRQGGFHVFARECALRGIDTVFFSFPRPYYGLFMRREQFNRRLILSLQKGAVYALEGGRRILNVTFPTFRLPDAFGKFLPARLMDFLAVKSLVPFRVFAEKHLSGTDCFVFESCEGIFLLPKIKRLFRDARIIYRPSDPLIFDAVPERLKKAERRMLYAADRTLIVNEEGLDDYRKTVPDFDRKVKWRLLSNGVDIESYLKKYDAPPLLRKQATVLYVGAWEVEWPLLFRAAAELSDLNFVVVCPNYPAKSVLEKVRKIPNLFYVDGIKPDEVPAWITNCSVVMVPYKTGFYKDRPLGITAKYYQAMAAKKPIVAYNDTPKLKDAGIPVAYTYGEFIAEVKAAVSKTTADYAFDLSGRDWKTVCGTFMEECGAEE